MCFLSAKNKTSNCAPGSSGNLQNRAQTIEISAVGLEAKGSNVVELLPSHYKSFLHSFIHSFPTTFSRHFLGRGSGLAKAVLSLHRTRSPYRETKDWSASWWSSCYKAVLFQIVGRLPDAEFAEFLYGWIFGLMTNWENVFKHKQWLVTQPDFICFVSVFHSKVHMSSLID